jgi:hypothetical protein
MDVLLSAFTFLSEQVYNNRQKGFCEGGNCKDIGE